MAKAENIRVKDLYELSCISGIAVAYRLGAEYEKFDDIAEKSFVKFLHIFHGARYRGKMTGQ